LGVKFVFNFFAVFLDNITLNRNREGLICELAACVHEVKGFFTPGTLAAIILSLSDRMAGASYMFTVSRRDVFLLIPNVLVMIFVN
jgi:hypothetical protein